MKRTRFTDEQIIGILAEHEAGAKCADLANERRRFGYRRLFALLRREGKAGWLLADRGHDADWSGEALKDNGIKVCIPGRKSRKKAVKYDKRRYKRRNRIEIMFGRLKD